MLRGMKSLIRFPLSPLLAVSLSSAGTVYAQAAAPEAGSSVLQMLLGLAFIVALIFASLWLLKRLSAPRGAGAHALRVIAGQAVGPRERVVIIEVGDTALVLGVAPGRVNTLHTLPRSALPPATQGASAPAQQFAARLRQVMEKRHAPRA